MISKLEGIIITETPYGENSKIVNILTKEKGLVGVMCNNVKSLKNPLRTKTQRFTYANFHINYNENKLSKLIDVDIIDNLSNIKNDIELISYAQYLNELTYQVYKQSESEDIYNLYISILLKLNQKQNPLILTNILELKYLDFLGVGLNLEHCVNCGDKKNILTIDPDEGGYICSNCYTNQKILSPKSIKLIRMFYLINIDTISSIKIDTEIANEINYFIDKYYERYTGLYLKTKDFLRKISKLK